MPDVLTVEQMLGALRELHIGLAVVTEPAPGEPYLAYINDIGARLMGSRPDDLIGQPSRWDLSPQEITTLAAARRAAPDGGTLPIFERTVLETATGTSAPVSVGYAAIQGVQVPTVLVLLLDARGRQRREGARRGRLDHLETLLEQLPIGFFQATPEGDLIEANRAMRALVGDPDGGLVSMDEVLPPENNWNGVVEEALEHGTLQGLELPLVRSDGTRCWVRYSLRAIEDEGGNLLYLEGVAEDITHQREAQQAVEDHARQLLRANRELEEFAEAASHDLQEPLRHVTSYVQLLARQYEGQLDEDADEYISYAVDGTRRLRRLLQAIRDFISVGHRPEEQTSVDLQRVADTTIQELDPLLEETGAHVTYGQLPTVRGHEPDLRRMIKELITNAVKFRSNQRAPEIHIDAEEAPEAWRLTVEDNGIGIAPQHRERVLNVFGRLHGPDDYPGLGIGLALCRRIAETHGGSIEIGQGEDAGTMIIVQLPKHPWGGFEALGRLQPAAEA